MEFLNVDCPTRPVSVNVSCFRGPSGVDEYHLIVAPTEPGDAGGHLDWVYDSYVAALDDLGLDESTAVVRRFFCSDLKNQAETLEQSPCSSRRDTAGTCAVSWVCQPPLPTAKVALWAYHIKDPAGELDLVRHNGTLTLNRGELGHQWTTGITSSNGSTAFEQTRGVFAQYDAMLRGSGLSITDHVLRTWLYVRDIDANYHGMVAARREFFAEHGLTPDTHFIASSGIEGSTACGDAMVSMDAYAIAAVRPQQISYPAALDHLGPTHSYGVTFERATSIAYRDRVHVILSGTASIDPDGKILYPGDVLKQLDRTLENMEALLDRTGGSLDDMSSFIVYVRDASDHAVARRRMRERFGGAPIQIVHAPVCRPGWLIEVEGTAVVPADNPNLPFF